MDPLLKYIISQTQLPEFSVKNTIQLLHEDCTIPFISRYRKERTGNLDEVQIGDIVKADADSRKIDELNSKE